MSQRVEKINELIKREIGQIIRREIEIPENSLVTVSRVRTSSDLKEAKIWISIFPVKHAQSLLKEFLKRAGYFQRLLNRRLSMRYIPKISFILDNFEEKIGQFEDILDETDQS